MAIIFKRREVVAAPTTPPSLDSEPTGSSKTSQQGVPQPAKPVFKIGGPGGAVKVGEPTQNGRGDSFVPPKQKPLPAPVKKVETKVSQKEQEALAAAGMAPAVQYPYVPSGDKVVITNDRMHWVKHWKPGDVAVVEQLMALDTLFDIDERDKYRVHILRIVEAADKSRVGGRCALFRYEFEPVGA